MGNLASKSDLTSYAKSSDLSSYAKSTDLHNYVAAELKTAMPSLQSTDIDRMTTALLSNNSFLNTVSTSLAGNASLSSAVATALSKDPNLIPTLSTSLQKSADLGNYIANVLTTNDTYKSRIVGPPGSINTGVDTTFAAGRTVTVPGTFKATGEFQASGTFNANKLYITNGWIGYPDKANDQSEISNDTSGFKQLMIVGNKASGTRSVGIWDKLTVNGNLVTTGSTKIGKFNFNPGGDQYVKIQDDAGNYNNYTLAVNGLWTDNIYPANNFSCKKPSEYSGVTFNAANSWDLACGGNDHPGRYGQGDGCFVMTLPTAQGKPIQMGICGQKIGIRRKNDNADTWTNWA